MKLTEPNAKLEVMVKATVPGMAHFAFTGPVGTTCRQCAFWNPDRDSLRPSRLKRDPYGFLKNRRCRKHSQLKQGVLGAGIPPEQASCRHFTSIEGAPDLHVEKKLADGLE